MSDTRPGGSDHPLAFLAHQHRQVEQIWTQLEAAHSTDNDVQLSLSQELVGMLKTHDALETELLYPALRERGGSRGEELAVRSLQEHAVVREQLQRIEAGDPRDEQVWSTLLQCIDNVIAHVEEEESEIFPLVQQVLDADAQAEMCRRMDEMVPASTGP